MHLLSYLLSTVVLKATNFKSYYAIAYWYKGVQTLQARGVDTEEKDAPSDSLDKILIEDTYSEGAIQNMLGGLTLCFN